MIKKHTRIFPIAMVVVLFAGLGVYLLAPSEPSYGGRALTSWLRQLDDGRTEQGLEWSSWPTNRTAKQAQAAEAIRHIGTNAVPYLLHAMTNRDPDLREKIMALLAKQHFIKVPPPSTNYLHRAAALGFDALGPAAKSAVPNLVRILETSNSGMNDDAPKNATIALAAIEPEGRTALMQLVKSNGWNSTCAIWGLSSHQAVVTPEVIQTLLGWLEKNPAGNGATAAFALGLLRQDAEQVVPALIRGLESKDLGTRWGSAYGLGFFGTNAASAVPALTAALMDPDTSVSNYAKQSLKQVDPEMAGEKDKK